MKNTISYVDTVSKLIPEIISHLEQLPVRLNQLSEKNIFRVLIKIDNMWLKDSLKEERVISPFIELLSYLSEKQNFAFLKHTAAPENILPFLIKICTTQETITILKKLSDEDRQQVLTKALAAPPSPHSVSFFKPASSPLTASIHADLIDAMKSEGWDTTALESSDTLGESPSFNGSGI